FQGAMAMFWGLNMKPERKYSQTIIKSFHISGVALDKGQEAKLYLAAEKQEYIVATVTKAIPQVALDLNFSKGDRIMFYTAGDASVSLLGYLHDIDSGS
uniref:39 KDA FK506-BINDING NUCLEAR PROTEIN n=1 Tax=Drosophila melanogaster TaxID=7227 RepID=UPI00052238BC|nr:Chain A, KDA FK506-BINDING NUCLEAR PROTEIN [Drosophila melanogaster]4CA9_B Chain B, KDA FK506-BINDING NUCLEAR PROTEIN [Drosophila melanogaster]4CA9_C Chain C, KDA FK506-BINDING NUCLEAR PROTEIN [Drosophila melanogaster]4CA9_D Chain D, KDA FK506-BINDING NUCLEAR PROTEIN [Drosophila melanogaster]4CA9_E Chain E, KDA FK506-BINDING NUCLEAR PROTEIN [Drosophila melanogaster]